ncbi:hypothetical protein V8D89_000081 [Ganoderma adspersum]
MGPSFSLPSPTPVLRSPVIEHKAFNAVEVEISGRDDIATPSSSDSSISLSDPQSSTLPLSSSTPVPVPSESPTGSSRGPTVPLSAVVGGAVGGGVVLVAFIAFIVVTRRQHGPRIEPFPLESDVEHQSREGHRRQMSHHNRNLPLSDVPIIRPPAPRQSQLQSVHPLLPSGARVHPLYDLKVTISETSLHGTIVPETPLGHTYSHNCDAVSVMSRESEWRRQRPLPRPPTSKPPPPPVPALPRDLLPRRDDMPLHMAAVAASAHAQPSLAVPSQSLASSAPLTSPISPLDIDIGDYSTGPGTSPPTFLPARRDSQLEPMPSPRRLPVPPPMQSPLTSSVLTAHDSEGDVEAEAEMEASLHLNFDADGRPDSPSVAKMYAELLELQRQVARLREDIPARHFGEAPPDYAESVVGSTCV